MAMLDALSVLLSLEQFRELLSAQEELAGLKRKYDRLETRVEALQGLYSEVLQALGELKELI